MRSIFYSLRFRLTVLNLTLFGFVQAMAFLGILAIREREISLDFDRWLHADALRMLEEVIAHSNLAEQRTPELNPFHLKGCYFQLRLSDGTTLEKSSNLADGSLPFGDLARQAGTGGPVIETLGDEGFAPTPGLSGKIRLLTVAGHARDGKFLYLQVGARLDRVNQAVLSLRRMLLLLFPVTMLLVGAASWLMASRSLRPIAEITSAIQKLSVDKLGHRVGVPARLGDLRSMVASINEMLERIEEGFRAQQRLAAEMSHELKTPVAVLLGEAQVFRCHARKLQEYDDFVVSVEDEMRGLARTIESLLLLGRANAGFRIPFSEVSITQVVGESVRRSQGVASRHGITLVPQLFLPGNQDVEPLLWGDEELLCSMLTNLIFNAVQHSPPAERVHIELSTSGSEAIIIVRDRGPGVPVKHVEQLFTPFLSGQADPGWQGGTGLGLSIVRRVVELHGGEVSLETPSSGGCNALVRLPLYGETNL